MIEEQLREAFARHESAVPDAARLVPAIDAEARRRRGRRRVNRSTSVALALIVVVAGIPTLGRTWLADRLSGPVPGIADADLPARSLNFLILGLDRLPSWPSGEPTRADAIIVAHVPRDRSAVFLMAIPRDLEVDIPSDPATNVAGYRTKINAAYALGGFALMARTVTDLTGLSFDGGAVVELSGLAHLVDELGGVPFCVTRRTKSIHTGRTFEAGCHRMTGAQARDFLRQRKDYVGGSAERAWYVTRFLGALLREVGSTGTLTSLDRMRATVGVVRRHVLVDTRGRDPVTIAWDLRHAVGNVVEVSVPVRYPRDRAPSNGNLLLTPDAPTLFEALRDDTMTAWVADNPDHGERVDE
jgi:LCP family protein required for cell wall assembly